MATWILLLRGINVGGRNVLPMADLVQILESLGLSDVRTYIQSGNVVFRSESQDVTNLESEIASRVDERFGFRPQCLILPADRLQKAIESNPFPEASNDPKSVHLFFLAATATEPDIDRLNAAKASSERFLLRDEVFYLHAPDGIGRSKLAANVERYVGVRLTARNWRTAVKLQEMAGL